MSVGVVTDFLGAFGMDPGQANNQLAAGLQQIGQQAQVSAVDQRNYMQAAQQQAQGYYAPAANMYNYWFGGANVPTQYAPQAGGAPYGYQPTAYQPPAGSAPGSSTAPTGTWGSYADQPRSGSTTTGEQTLSYQDPYATQSSGLTLGGQSTYGGATGPSGSFIGQQSTSGGGLTTT